MCVCVFQGGVGDEVSLTAYITAALLEVETPLTVSMRIGWAEPSLLLWEFASLFLLDVKLHDDGNT